MALDITGVHGGLGKDPESPFTRHIVNRIIYAVEDLYLGKETELLLMLGDTSNWMRGYALKKWKLNERDILADVGQGHSSLQEVYSFRVNYVEPNKYNLIGAVSNHWHLERLKILYNGIMPDCSVSYFGIEDGRPEREIKIDTDKERILMLVDRVRLKLPLSVAASEPVQKFLELGRDLYFATRRYI